ncbi:MAG: DUF1003 domain-containing protein [Chitinophagaceae bacterium]
MKTVSSDISSKKYFTSDLSGKNFPLNEKVKGKYIRDSIMKTICNEHPEFSSEKVLSLSELNHYRQQYIESVLKDEAGKLSSLDANVIEKIKNNEVVSLDMENDNRTPSSWKQRLADRVAAVGGSWSFITGFVIFMTVWISVNLIMAINQKAFDPYPFILLNLLLSTIAALQAPVIMMSQNRQEEKDRQRSKQDYMVNLKAELEIQLLHEKLDHLLLNQQQEMMEIQQIQIEMMEDIIKKLSRDKDNEQE